MAKYRIDAQQHSNRGQEITRLRAQVADLEANAIAYDKEVVALRLETERIKRAYDTCLAESISAGADTLSDLKSSRLALSVERARVAQLEAVHADAHHWKVIAGALDKESKDFQAEIVILKANV